MSYLTKMAAAVAAAGILLLSPGAQAAVSDDTLGASRSYADDRRGDTTAAGGSFADERRASTGQATAVCPEGMIPTFCTHFGLETEETTTAPARPVPVVVESNTVGQIIGWTAAGVAVGSAGVAGFMFLRRRHHGDELPHAA